MSRYRKILVAFDGSDSSTNALLQSFRLAGDEKSWLTVATVVPTYEGDLDLTGVNDIHDALRRPGEEILSRAKSLARREGALIKTVLEEGEPFERLAHLAESENYSLIVMGRRGKSSPDRAYMGSTTARVIGHTSKDVLIVPEGSSLGWKKMLAATDGSRSSRVAMERAIDLAKSYGSKLSVVSVVDVPSEFYAEAINVVDRMVAEAKAFVSDARTRAEAEGIGTTGFVREGEAHEVITSIAMREGNDVILLGSHGRTGIKRLLMGSVTEKVIGYAPCPVLVVKTQETA